MPLKASPSPALSPRSNSYLYPPEPHPLRRIEELKKKGLFPDSFDVALRYLSYRPQSETELRLKLRRRRFDRDATEQTIIRLKEQGLLDDTAFARFWKESREALAPRSGRLIKLELKQKGVESEITEQVIEEIDDESSAYRAASKRARALVGLDYQSFKRRLGGFLQRRGFDYGVIKRVVNQLWQEQQISRAD